MENRFTTGFIAGIIAGLFKDIPNFILHHYPKIAEITLWDYAGAIALGRLPQGPAEHIYAVFLEILFSVFVAMVFVNIRVFQRLENYKLKGILYGAFIWFIVRAAVLAFHIRILLGESLGTSIVNLLVSMFYGCVLACTVKFIVKKF